MTADHVYHTLAHILHHKISTRTCFTILPSKDTATVVTALSRQVGKLPGFGQYGTLGAAEFICNPKGIHRITDHLPKNWPDKNLQVVLRISIVNLKPTASEICLRDLVKVRRPQAGAEVSVRSWSLA